MLVADIPLNVKCVSGDRFVPIIVTLVPTGPVSGATLAIVGTGVTVKSVGLVAVPPSVETATGESAGAVGGTIAMICVAVSLVMLVAAMPPKVTLVAFARAVPVIVTLVPIGPVTGAIVEIVGDGITVKDDELVAVPPGVVIAMGPVPAPLGIVICICVALVTEYEVTVTLLTVTTVGSERFVP